MKEYFKKLLQIYLNQPFVTHHHTGGFDVKSYPQGYFKSFGDKNADKIFYVIWLDNGGSGFFSNVSNVLCHLKLADQLGMMPVVDFFNFKTLYNVTGEINNTENAWEYYFKPVSEFSLPEVYQSKNVFFCSGSYPPSLGYSITAVHNLPEVYHKYIRLQHYIEKMIEDHTIQLKFEGRILGIHFRGQEQKLAPRHSFPPTEKQMIRYCDMIIEKHKIERIFIVTEEQRYLDLFIKKYNKKLIYTDSFRTYNTNAYNLNPRDNHRYRLGLEVLVDAFLLSRCTGLLCSDSNVSEFTRFVNNKNFEFTYTIQNGVNSSNKLLARHLFGLKKNIPSALGGLQDNVMVYQNSN